jgi:hypothetical protein
LAACFAATLRDNEFHDLLLEVVVRRVKSW